MKEDILTEIIKVEKEIRERIDSEKRRSKEKIEKVKRDLEDEIHVEEKGLKESTTRAMEDARIRAEDEAQKIIGKAITETQKLESLSDEEIKRIITRYIIRILPEKR